MHLKNRQNSLIYFSLPRVWGKVKLYRGKVVKQKKSQRYNIFYFLKSKLKHSINITYNFTAKKHYTKSCLEDKTQDNTT